MKILAQGRGGSGVRVRPTGTLTEKPTCQSWSRENEFRIQDSLERDYLPGLPIVDHYYCRSLYLSEEQAKRLEPDKAVRVRFEQD